MPRNPTSFRDQCAHWSWESVLFLGDYGLPRACGPRNDAEGGRIATSFQTRPLCHSERSEAESRNLRSFMHFISFEIPPRAALGRDDTRQNLPSLSFRAERSGVEESPFFYALRVVSRSCCGARHLPASTALLGICRPLPLAQVASSASGGAPIAPPPRATLGRDDTRRDQGPALR